MLSGFDLAVLRDSGCFGNIENGIDIAKPSDLGTRTTLHPLFAKENWPTSEAKDINNGIPGKWDPYGNSQVRLAFMPCLYLASSMLHHAINSKWYDGLLFGPRTYVEEQFDDGCDPFNDIHYHVSSFRQRDDPVTIAQDRAERLKLSLLGGKFHFHIEPLATSRSKFRTGLTQYNNCGKLDSVPGGRISLAAEMVLPLLMGFLTPSEQLAQLFCLGSVLVHEVMHATNNSIIGQFGRRKEFSEPFYDTEAISEIGRSWENANTYGFMKFFGHEIGGISYQDAPVLGITMQTYPNYARFDGKYSGAPLHQRFRYPERFQRGSVMKRWPVDSLFVENMNQADYWQVHVAKFERGSLKPPEVFGKLWERYHTCFVILGKDFERYHGHDGNILALCRPENLDELDSWERHMRQRTNANAFKLAERVRAGKKRIQAFLGVPSRLEYLYTCGQDYEAQQRFIEHIKALIFRGTEAIAKKYLDVLVRSNFSRVRSETWYLASGMSNIYSLVERRDAAKKAVRAINPWSDQTVIDPDNIELSTNVKQRLKELEAEPERHNVSGT